MINKISDIAMKYLRFVLSITISWFLDKWFEFRVWVLSVRYGGEDKIPKEVMSQLLEPGMAEYKTTVCCVYALNQVCRKLQLNLEDLETTYAVHALFNNGEGLTADDMTMLGKIIDSKTKRRTVLESLIGNGDIRKELVNFQLGGEPVEEFERWLDEDDDTVWEVEPKIYVR